MKSELIASFDRMLSRAFSPAAVRAIEAGGAWDTQWEELDRSGYLDALVPERAGGAGLSLAELAPLLFMLGRHAVPLPVGETMVARALLSAAGADARGGPIALATRAPIVAFACVARAFLQDDGEALRLVHCDSVKIERTGVPHDLAGRAVWPRDAHGERAPRPDGGLRPIAALLRAAGIAGAADRVVATTVDYAGQRAQFGKPIGSRQAIQQQIAVMAEHAVAARLAVETACAWGLAPPPLACAAAKAVASTAAVQVATIAHAVHGAIGISAEHELQLFTRALHAWRLAEGAESYWHREIGAAALLAPPDSVAWVRETMFAPPASA